MARPLGSDGQASHPPVHMETRDTIPSNSDTSKRDAPTDFGGVGIQDLVSKCEELEARVATLDEERKHAVRRRDILLGEREQLRWSVANSERQVQELSQEVGALKQLQNSRGARLLPVVGRTFASRVAAIFVGGGKDDAGPGGANEGPIADTPTPRNSFQHEPLIPFVRRGIKRPTIAVLALDLSREDLESVSDTVSAIGETKGLIPVIFTDMPDFSVFRERRIVFEYFPPKSVQDTLAPDRDWELYLRRRLALFVEKWQPVDIVAFGPRSHEIAESLESKNVSAD